MSVVARTLGVDDVSFLRSVDVQLILLVSAVSSMGAIASPALPAMSDALGVGPARIGLVFTAYTLPAILVLPVVGVVADVYSRRAVIVPGLLLFGGAGLAVGLVTDFRLILVLRALQGVGYVAFNALTVALLGDRLSGEAETAAQGVRVLLNKSAGFVGPAVAGVLAAVAWNYPFFLFGLAIPVGLLVAVTLGPMDDDGTVDEAGADGGTGDDGVTGSDDQPSETVVRRSIRTYFGEMGALVRDPFIAAVLAGGFFRMVMKYGLYAFLALAVVTRYSGSVATAGLLVGLYSLVGAAVASQSARLIGALSHAYALVLGFAVAAVALLAFPLAGSLAGVTVLVLVHGAGEGVINPVHKSLMSQSVAADVRAGLVTSNALVQDVAKTVTPVVLGAVLVALGGAAYGTLFLLTGAVVLVATGVAFVALLVGDRSPRRPTR